MARSGWLASSLGKNFILANFDCATQGGWPAGLCLRDHHCISGALHSGERACASIVAFRSMPSTMRPTLVGFCCVLQSPLDLLFGRFPAGVDLHVSRCVGLLGLFGYLVVVPDLPSPWAHSFLSLGHTVCTQCVCR